MRAIGLPLHTFFFVLFFGCGVVFLSGCSYYAGQGNRQIPGGYRLVAVPVFANNTIEAGVETYFTNALVRALESSKLAKITPKSAAQVALEGSVDSIIYATNPLPAGGGLDDVVLTNEYRIYLQASVRLRRISDQTIIWQGKFSGERSYLAPQIFKPGINSANALYNHSARYQNIQAMAQDTMTEAFDRLTENF